MPTGNIENIVKTLMEYAQDMATAQLSALIAHSPGKKEEAVSNAAEAEKFLEGEIRKALYSVVTDVLPPKEYERREETLYEKIRDAGLKLLTIWVKETADIADEAFSVAFPAGTDLKAEALKEVKDFNTKEDSIVDGSPPSTGANAINLALLGGVSSYPHAEAVTSALAALIDIHQVSGLDPYSEDDGDSVKLAYAYAHVYRIAGLLSL